MPNNDSLCIISLSNRLVFDKDVSGKSSTVRQDAVITFAATIQHNNITTICVALYLLLVCIIRLTSFYPYIISCLYVNKIYIYSCNTLCVALFPFT